MNEDTKTKGTNLITKKDGFISRGLEYLEGDLAPRTTKVIQASNIDKLSLIKGIGEG